VKTVAFYNLKGGVGKTAAAVNVAYQASQDGVRTLFWDLDPQGAASWYFRIKPKLEVKTSKIVKGKVPAERLVQRTEHPGLDLIPADFSFRNMDLLIRKAGDPEDLIGELLQPLDDLYALAVLDCPPSFSRVSENVFCAASALLVPLIPTHLSLRAFEQMAKYFRKAGLNRERIQPFFSMVDRRRKLHREWLERPPPEISNLFGTHIPYSALVERMGEQRAPVPVFAPRSPVSAAYRALWTEVRARISAS
jgi:chromosome partitioning protein